jgi:hypothetical protein
LALNLGAALRWVGRFWKLAQKVQSLLESQEKTAKAIAALDEDLRSLKLEVERLKAREEVVVARAEAAASGAAMVVVSNTVADTARCA